MKRIINGVTATLPALLLTLAFQAGAEAPGGYYAGLEGKSGVALKKAAKAAARDHTAVSYGKNGTWTAFRQTDVRNVNGQDCWWDMYSTDNIPVSAGAPPSGMNIEHSVANSWWGGSKNDAYKDLFHLNPSNSNANSRKSNYPLGECASVEWDNGVTFVGLPKSGLGGGNKYVYEPADEYKGDFARAYFYMFTVYDDISWKSGTDWMYTVGSELLLKPWATEMLLRWAEEDPVSQKEIERNEAIYGIQHNRNPFIDNPTLASHIWGELATTPFHAGETPVPDPVEDIDAPDGYYELLVGKNGATLKSAVKERISKLSTVDYGDKTWEAFKTTDVRRFEGRDAWWDMYSDYVVYTSDGHPGMNIEHSVANSWWGGVKNDAYKDLYHLNPSNSDANNRKSNHPLGEVGTVNWTNLVSTIGRPEAGTGGGSETVFEPADEYKGDFARAYFYVFTLYDNIGWDSEYGWMYDCLAYPSLKGWATDMLLRWAEEDPVDSREAARNAAVAKIQGNRNPYIDIPRLAECVWGEKAGQLTADDLSAREIVDRPASPRLEGYSPVMFDTYSLTWWNQLSLAVEVPAGATGEYTFGGAWEPIADGTITIPAASGSGETRTLMLRSTDGKGMKSARTIVRLTSVEPGSGDILKASWIPVSSTGDLNESEDYIIVTSGQSKVMGADGGTSSQKYMSVAGDVTVGADGTITEIPVETAVVNLARSGSGWILEISDTHGESKGWWTTTSARNMRLGSRSDATAATLTVSSGTTAIDFGSAGKLQYNKQAPRFLNYTSSQEPVLLYRRNPLTEVTEVHDGSEDFGVWVEYGTLHVSEGCRVFDMQGREITANRPEPGIYIVTDGRRTVKVALQP